MTNNEQTPGGNTTTAGAVEMARRIADELIPNPENESVVYKSFHRTAERAALAAIIQTTEAATKLIDDLIPSAYTATDAAVQAMRDGEIHQALMLYCHLKGPQP